MEKDFITAYVWLFRSTRKQALQVYKTAETGYIEAVITAFKDNAKRAFYND